MPDDRTEFIDLLRDTLHIDSEAMLLALKEAKKDVEKWHTSKLLSTAHTLPMKALYALMEADTPGVRYQAYLDLVQSVTVIREIQRRDYRREGKG